MDETTIRRIIREEIAASLGRMLSDADYWTGEGDIKADINWEIRDRLEAEISRLS